MYECASRNPSTPTADAMMKTASRHGGETVGVVSVGEFRCQEQDGDVNPRSRPRHAERHGITAAEAEGGEASTEAAIGQGVQQRH